MYINQVINYFLQKPLKGRYLFICLGKALERATMFTFFIISLFNITSKYLTNPLALDIFLFICFYLPIMLIYGVFREINFDYKASKAYQKFKNEL